jgi:rhodanese-related sulfurtransferase
MNSSNTAHCNPEGALSPCAEGTPPGRLGAVATGLGEISRESLWQKIESGEEFVLVDALSPISYAASHLPGAINITPLTVDRLCDRRIPTWDTDVVVYCQSPTCDSSVEVAHRLIELGYRNVSHYAGGKNDWRDAGLPLEGGRV